MIKKFVEKITYTNCACHNSHCTCLEDEVRDYGYDQTGFRFSIFGFEFSWTPALLTKNYRKSEPYFSSTWGVPIKKGEITNVKINNVLPPARADERLVKWLSK